MRGRGGNRPNNSSGRGYGCGRRGYRPNNNYHNANHHHKGEGSKYELGKRKNVDEKCYKCGMNNHWERKCHTSQHLVDLYQASLREKKAEANFVEDKTIPSPYDATHLDVSDFFTDHGYKSGISDDFFEIPEGANDTTNDDGSTQI